MTIAQLLCYPLAGHGKARKRRAPASMVSPGLLAPSGGKTAAQECSRYSCPPMLPSIYDRKRKRVNETIEHGSPIVPITFVRSRGRLRHSKLGLAGNATGWINIRGTRLPLDFRRAPPKSGTVTQTVSTRGTIYIETAGPRRAGAKQRRCCTDTYSHVDSAGGMAQVTFPTNQFVVRSGAGPTIRNCARKLCSGIIESAGTMAARRDSHFQRHRAVCLVTLPTSCHATASRNIVHRCVTSGRYRTQPKYSGPPAITKIRRRALDSRHSRRRLDALANRIADLTTARGCSSFSVSLHASAQGRPKIRLLIPRLCNRPLTRYRSRLRRVARWLDARLGSRGF